VRKLTEVGGRPPVSKSKIHHLLNYVGRKKEIPRKSLIFLGWLNLPPKFDTELLNLFTKHKIIIMYKEVLATISYFLCEIIK
jgi:hypothetical protein